MFKCGFSSIDYPWMFIWRVLFRSQLNRTFLCSLSDIVDSERGQHCVFCLIETSHYTASITMALSIMWSYPAIYSLFLMWPLWHSGASVAVSRPGSGAVVTNVLSRGRALHRAIRRALVNNSSAVGGSHIFEDDFDLLKYWQPCLLLWWQIQR